MEHHHDEHIDCADCGAPFVFSADEAAVFAERGLAAPKRCKDCRRARKERAGNEGVRGGHGGHGGHPFQRANGNGQGGAGAWNGRDARAPRYGAPAPRYTGDVNEYRSPMQGAFSGTSYGRAPQLTMGGSRPPQTLRNNPQGPRPPRFAGEHRSPMSRGFARPSSNHGGQANGRPAIDADGRGAGAASAGAEGAPRPSRRRPQAEMFAITCDACGAQAEVPFKPAEGREVYCPTCYRARRPAP